MATVFSTFAKSWWSIVLLAILTGIILYQRWMSIHPDRPIPIAPGTRVVALDLKELSGKPVRVSFGHTALPTLIYIFSPQCSWCRRNHEALTTVINQARGYRCLGIALTSSGLEQYLVKRPLNCPIYLGDIRSKQLGAMATPETLIVSSAGVVQKVWFGAYTGAVGKEIEMMFGLQLPEIGSLESL